MTGTVVVMPEGEGTPTVPEIPTPAQVVADTVAVIEAVADVVAPGDAIMQRLENIERIAAEARDNSGRALEQLGQLQSTTQAVAAATTELVIAEIEEDDEPDVAPDASTAEFVEIPAATTEEVITEIPEVVERITKKTRYFV